MVLFGMVHFSVNLVQVKKRINISSFLKMVKYKITRASPLALVKYCAESSNSPRMHKQARVPTARLIKNIDQ